MRACSGVRRVITSMWRSPASRVTAADAGQFAQGAGGGEVLVGEVGVAQVGGGEGVGDERFDDGGVDAHGDVAVDAVVRSSAAPGAGGGSL